MTADDRSLELPEGDRIHADGVYHALPDPIADRQFSVLMALAAEVWTVRDRLRLVERALADRGMSLELTIESLVGDESELQSMRADRDAFVERVLSAVTPGGRTFTS